MKMVDLPPIRGNGFLPDSGAQVKRLEKRSSTIRKIDFFEFYRKPERFSKRTTVRNCHIQRIMANQHDRFRRAYLSRVRLHSHPVKASNRTPNQPHTDRVRAYPPIRIGEVRRTAHEAISTDSNSFSHIPSDPKVTIRTFNDLSVSPITK
jgi:hypothetical protein